MSRSPQDFDDPAGSDRPASAARSAPETARTRWEQGVLEKLVMETVAERKRARRWNIFLRLLTLAWLSVVLLMFGGWFDRDLGKTSARHTALVEIDGVIGADGENAAERIVPALRLAFEDTRTAGVVLRVNSPGGSPVQAGIIFDEIRRLRGLHADTPLYAVIEEVGASGGYYIAAAADRIYVDKASLVGSIGVVMGGFGFAGALERLGIERRLLTAGEDKAFMDSFSPLSDSQRQHAQQMLDQVHQQFIAKVREGRAARLADDPGLFSGRIWTGERSIELGLADGLGSVASVARDVIQVERIVDFSQRHNLVEKLARRVGASAGETLARVLAGGQAGWTAPR
ncbi:MAG: S49 family peptidase [Burkholderiaceae bacterium]